MKLKKDTKVVVLTGAGISKASGINTFRDEGGVWDKYDPNVVCTYPTCLLKPNRKISWRFFQDCYEEIKDKDPNLAHVSLVKLEEYLDDGCFTIITQNVDGLHSKAGSKSVIEMHGNKFSLKCGRTSCTYTAPMEKHIHSKKPVMCPECGTMLRPSTVMFHETPKHVHEIDRLVKECDLFISIGTSGTVYPACDLIHTAYYHKARVMVVNVVAEDKDARYHYKLGKAEEVLPTIVEELTND